MMLFLGAGASKPFGIKTMKEMSKEFENSTNLTKDERELYLDIRNVLDSDNLEDLLTILNDLSSSTAGNKILENPSVGYFKFYIDWLFEKLKDIAKKGSKEIKRQKGEALQEETQIKRRERVVIVIPKTLGDRLNELKETLRGKSLLLDPKLSNNIKSKIIEFVKEKCDIDKKVKENHSTESEIEKKYDKLFEILENFSPPFNIFITNYDRIIETYFESKGNSDGFFDGFTCKDPRICDWKPEGYDKDYKYRLFKLHGSVDQYIEDGRIIKCWREPQGVENAMIYPMREKEVYKDPFFELFTRLKTSLLSEEICIIIGYSFGDEHIRNIFFDAVKRNPEIRIFLMNPNAQKIIDNLEPIKDNIEPIEAKFGEERVFEELEQKFIEV